MMSLAPPPEQRDEQYMWIGLAIILGAAILSNLGVNIQKLSHIREGSFPPLEQKVYYYRPLWIVGMACILLGSFADFEALGFAPQAFVAAVGGGCTVLANVYFGHIWLGQPLSREDLVGTVVIIIGVFLSATANEPDDKLTLAQLESQFAETGFIIYVSLMGSILVWTLQQVRTSPDGRHLPYYYATASGIFGSFSVLLAKCASELVLLTLGGDNQFNHTTTWLFVGGMIVTLLLQTDLLNRSIMVGDTVAIFPVFQCMWIGSSVIGGVVFYQKYRSFSTYQWIALPVALLFIIWGIYLLAKHQESSTVIVSEDLLDTTSLLTNYGATHGGTRFNYGTILTLSPVMPPRRHYCFHDGRPTFEDTEDRGMEEGGLKTKNDRRRSHPHHSVTVQPSEEKRRLFLLT